MDGGNPGLGLRVTGTCAVSVVTKAYVPFFPPPFSPASFPLEAGRASLRLCYPLVATRRRAEPGVGLERVRGLEALGPWGSRKGLRVEEAQKESLETLRTLGKVCGEVRWKAGWLWVSSL